MNTFEITIQRKVGDGWPVVVEQKTLADPIPIRKEGVLELDEIELQMQPSALEYGCVLGEALFRGAIRDAFAKAVGNSPDRLRVLLFVEADDLQALRWERLCAPLDGQWDFLYLNQRTLYSLYLPSITDRRFPSIGRRDLRALVLIASPQGLAQYDLQPFDVAATAAGVRTALGDIPYDLLADVEDAVGPASLDALTERITAEPYTILHIVCHGQFSHRTGDTSLFLADAHNQVDRVDGTRLLRRLRQLQGAYGLPHLVFLAACETSSAAAQASLGGLGQRLVRDLGMPAVIAMTDKVSVDTAQALTTGFYQRLPHHGEVDRALVEAMAPLASRPDIITPALYSRLGERPLFSDNAERALTNQELAFGLQQLHELMPERAPVLLPKMEKHGTRLRATLGGDPSLLTPAAQRERERALNELEWLSQESLDMSFAALSLGKEPPPYDGRCPFRGLNAFKSSDHEFFFGREAVVERLYAKLQQGNFLALLGASGSGKTSLVSAGLLHRLRQDEPQVRFCRFSPGADPLSQLQRHLPDIHGFPPDGVLLFIDHFEELFTLCTEPEERQLFVTKLLEVIEAAAPAKRADALPPMHRTATLATTAARHRASAMHPAWHADARPEGIEVNPERDYGVVGRNPVATKHLPAPRVRIVVAMRADFWGECARYPALKRYMLAHQELIDAMNMAELRRTMELQAHKVGLRFETDLSHTILDEVRDEPGAMPLLQHVLLELWKRRHGRWLRSEEYRQLGGVQKAIAYTADRFYESLTEGEQLRIQEIFVRLTRIDDEPLESAHRDTRRRVRTEELIPDDGQRDTVKALLARLADAKLIITSTNPATELEEVEVAHEALIRHWPRLQSWIHENRTRYRLRQSISRAAHAWSANERNADFLIHRGGQLEDAVQLTELPDFLTALERAYVDACIELRERERRREIESARQIAQAAEARRRAEEDARRIAEKRADERAATARNLRRWAMLAACVGFLAIAATGMASLFWQTARAERDDALRDESRLLATFALQELTSDPVSSLHMALAALPSPDNLRPYIPQAEFATMQAIHSSLERAYLQVSDRIVSAEQVAFGASAIAVAGATLRLVNYDLSRNIELASIGEPFTGVIWLDRETLLSTTQQGVQLWQNGALQSEASFEQNVQCAKQRPLGQPDARATDARTTDARTQWAICSGDALWLWTPSAAEPQRVLQFAANIVEAAWSPDGRLLMAQDTDGALTIWDTQTQHVVAFPQTDTPVENGVWTAAWAPGGQHLVVVRANGVVQIWHVDNAHLSLAASAELRPPAAEEPERLALGDIEFVDQERFVIWESRLSPSLWDVAGERLQKFTTYGGLTRGLSLSPDGTMLLTFTDTGVGHLWRLDTGEQFATLHGHRASILSANWHGDYVATSGADGTVRIWSRATGEELVTLYGHTEGVLTGRADVLGLYWSDEQHLMTYGEDGSLRKWAVFDEDGHPRCAGMDAYGAPRCYHRSQVLPGHEGDIWSTRWLDEETILTTGADGTARRWSLASGQAEMLPNEDDAWREVVWSPDGEQVFTFAPDIHGDAAMMKGLVWDFAAKEWIARVDGPIVNAFWIDTGLFVGLASGDLLRIEPMSGAVLTRYVGHATAVTQIDAYGGLLATTSGDGVTHIWELETGVNRSVFQLDKEIPNYDVQWSSDGRYLLTVGLSVVLWDVVTEQVVWRYDLTDFNAAAEFSPDGRFVAVAAGERAVVLDAQRGTPVWETPAHEQLVMGLAWSHGVALRGDAQLERRLLLTWSGDGSARMWDMNGHAELLRLSDEGPLNVAAISPNGQHIATAGYTGQLRIWDSWLRDPQGLRAAAQAEITRPLYSTLNHEQSTLLMAAH